MREIKFRAWDDKEKKFLVEGFHVIGEYTMFNIIEQHCYETRGELTTLERLIDIELMQFTGLTDKNGKEIYEYDYWLHPNGTLYEIFWHNGGFMYGFKDDNYGYYFYEGIAIQGEIKGNIYEHKHLLV